LKGAGERSVGVLARSIVAIDASDRLLVLCEICDVGCRRELPGRCGWRRGGRSLVRRARFVDSSIEKNPLSKRRERVVLQEAVFS
jgi:hypothetical protein